MGQNFFKAVSAIALLVSGAAAHAEGNLLMTYSFDSLKGKFGQTQDTKANALTLGATYVDDGYRASVFIPYISLEGPGTFVNGTVTNNGNNTTRKTSGLGDVLTSLSVDFEGSPSSKGLSYGSTFLLKLPLGDKDKGLGTGKTDYALQGDVGYRTDGGIAFTGNFGRQIYGTTPTLRLQDGNYLQAGMTIPFSNEFSVNFNASQRDALVAGGAKPKMRGISAVYTFSPTAAFQLGYSKGYSSASPDKAFSAALIVQQ